MRGSKRRWPSVVWGLAVTVAGLLTVVQPATPSGPSAAAATERPPDLKTGQIRDLRIVTTAGGRRLLRFTSLMWNKGAGPFEVRGSRPDTRTPWDVDQLIYDSDGEVRRVQTSARLRYAGDGHDHWHVRDMMTYHLWGDHGTLRDSKIGFCFFDTNLIDGTLPRSPSGPVYRESMCGTRTSERTRTGISVGWGDKYPWNFAFQYIDISDLSSGTYTLRSVVDLYELFEESTETNNCAWVRVRIGARGSGVDVVDRGTACVDDHSTTKFASHIAWALEQGISSGCDADLFCTFNPVSRGQMATFLVRALDLPPATRDHFDDDDGTTHESNINRVAEADIARGCGQRRYCPDARVSRGQMATFLVRALDLLPTDQDFFDDDETSSHEDEINALAAAGLTSGCGDGAFCPSLSVSRGQMATFLHRAFGTTAATAGPGRQDDSPAAQ